MDSTCMMVLLLSCALSELMLCPWAEMAAQGIGAVIYARLVVALSGGILPPVCRKIHPRISGVPNVVRQHTLREKWRDSLVQLTGA
ncbi:hypothetical protein PVT68_01705 [Microbulbifer bruguierae]|uniref:Secreted protein n=1 Tax=Microbulbifer bruguierae TaxID=3029061 RepID=A0ABY8NH53_9GAMM|nr:hypothetical protein [Microbulbifer bruguierae]WGL17027.1 hypothetical protein PVT68_01705 [Microbulbifer bruguierae]